jgi:hypothetical protein
MLTKQHIETAISHYKQAIAFVQVTTKPQTIETSLDSGYLCYGLCVYFKRQFNREISSAVNDLLYLSNIRYYNSVWLIRTPSQVNFNQKMTLKSLNYRLKALETILSKLN